jgi:hypothetical protein
LSAKPDEITGPWRVQVLPGSGGLVPSLASSGFGVPPSGKLGVPPRHPIVDIVTVVEHSKGPPQRLKSGQAALLALAEMGHRAPLRRLESQRARHSTAPLKHSQAWALGQEQKENYMSLTNG